MAPIEPGQPGQRCRTSGKTSSQVRGAGAGIFGKSLAVVCATRAAVRAASAKRNPFPVPVLPLQRKAVLSECIAPFTLVENPIDRRGAVSRPNLENVRADIQTFLRPNGVFAGVDSLESRFFGLIHLFENLVLVDPEAFPDRLRAVGFRDVQVDVNPYAFRFRAYKTA